MWFIIQGCISYKHLWYIVSNSYWQFLFYCYVCIACIATVFLLSMLIQVDNCDLYALSYMGWQFQQVLNGLLEREDWDTAIKMPLGVVPAGLFSYFLMRHVEISKQTILNTMRPPRPPKRSITVIQLLLDVVCNIPRVIGSRRS